MQFLFDGAGHLGYFLLLLSFTMGELWKLRTITILANLCILLHFYTAYETPSWIPMGWAIAYTLVNVVQIIRERKPAATDTA